MPLLEKRYANDYMIMVVIMVVMVVMVIVVTMMVMIVIMNDEFTIGRQGAFAYQRRVDFKQSVHGFGKRSRFVVVDDVVVLRLGFTAAGRHQQASTQPEHESGRCFLKELGHDLLNRASDGGHDVIDDGIRVGKVPHDPHAKHRASDMLNVIGQDKVATVNQRVRLRHPLPGNQGSR